MAQLSRDNAIFALQILQELEVRAVANDATQRTLKAQALQQNLVIILQDLDAQAAADANKSIDPPSDAVSTPPADAPLDPNPPASDAVSTPPSDVVTPPDAPADEAAPVDPVTPPTE